ncbi:MAG: hypothetical protein JWM68_5391 [Verrucomicrobiales bacterium]|nr:hypothetical protein [Verrucomicrobiales bacterium]
MVSLVTTSNLKGLPPTTIINAQIDPLRSEGEMLAGKLQHGRRQSGSQDLQWRG